MSTVIYEKGGRITLNRPEVLNAIDDKLPHDLAACVEEANTGLCKKERKPMPVDSCLLLYICEGCGATLRPTARDCCVFCTFGSIACPPKQKQTMIMV